MFSIVISKKIGSPLAQCQKTSFHVVNFDGQDGEYLSLQLLNYVEVKLAVVRMNASNSLHLVQQNIYVDRSLS